MWRRASNIRWIKLSNCDPWTVHLAYTSDQPGTKNMYASPCTQMTLLGVYYGELSDAQANCLACLAAEPHDESMRGDFIADG